MISTELSSCIVVEEIRTHPPFEPDLPEAALTCTRLADHRAVFATVRWHTYDAVPGLTLGADARITAIIYLSSACSIWRTQSITSLCG